MPPSADPQADRGGIARCGAQCPKRTWHLQVVHAAELSPLVDGKPPQYPSAHLGHRLTLVEYHNAG